MISDLPPTTRRSRQLDWGQSVVNLLEIGTNSVNFVNQIFNAVDSNGTQSFFNDGIAVKFDSLTVDQNGTSFVDHLFDGFLRRITPGDKGISHSKHVDGRFVQSDEDGLTNLSQSEDLQNFLRLRRDLINTSDSSNHSQFGSIRNEIVTVSLGSLGVVG